MIPPPIKYLCYAALVDLFKYLPASKANPQAVDVRQKLQIASWMSLWPIKLEKYRCIPLFITVVDAPDDGGTALARSACLMRWDISLGLRTASRMASLP